MQFIENGSLRPLHSRPMMISATTKVRRKLFQDEPPLDQNKIKRNTANILDAEYERFKSKFNFDFDANKPLPGKWNWQSVDSDEAPSFYTKAYPAKNASFLRKHLMACVQDRARHLNDRNHFLSLANLVTLTPCEDELSSLASTASTIHPVLPETPCKGAFRPIRGSLKRKLTPQTDDLSDYSDENSVPKSSSPSQDSVGQNLQNIPSPTPSSQTTQTTAQDKQTRQTNITDYMKYQKHSEPAKKHARRS